MELEKLLELFNEERSGDPLKLNTEGICRFYLIENLLVSLEKSVEDGGFYLYSVIGFVPPAKEKKMSIEALSGNLFGKDTGKACLGYIPESHTLILFQYIPGEGTDLPAFKRVLEEFSAYLKQWHEKLEQVETLEEVVSSARHVSSTKGLQIFFA